jgi:hypothetical protein
MSDTQTRLDAVKLAEWREHVRLLRNEPSIHMNHDDLLMFIDELERVTAALREARPYVVNIASDSAHKGWRQELAAEILGRIDAALAGGARAAQENQ